MKPAIDILFEYLQNTIYEPENAVLDVAMLPEDFQDLGSGVQFFAECVMEINALAQALAKGDLVGAPLPGRDNEMAAPLKALHASLKHLTWQARQVAKGDYKQRVAFLGEFADSFNTMVEQLADRQKKLEDEIAVTLKKSAALERGAILLTTLIQHVSQQIFVIEKNTLRVLLMNDLARKKIEKSPGYLENLMRLKSYGDNLDEGQEIEATYTEEGIDQHLIITSYLTEWHGSPAEVVVVSDVSATKNQMKKLETHAYEDNLTRLYNRTFGMLTLDEWLQEKKCFVLIFCDLDRLKYINDEFGHNEGDVYIVNAGEYLKTFSADAVVCRLGGDEFMLLAPDISYDEAHAAMSRLCGEFEKAPYLKDKEFTYNMSFGIVAVDTDNVLPMTDILGIADEKMYEYKKMRKKARQA